MKRFKGILHIGFSEEVCPFRFFCHSRSFLRKMLILFATLILFSWSVGANRSSAWTARLYVEGDDLVGDTGVMIGVASKAYQKVRTDKPDPNSVVLDLYTPEGIPLLEDIRRKGKMQYTWIIWVTPMIELLDPNREIPKATLRWDFSSFSLYDLNDPTDLVIKLRDASDPISRFLQKQFSPNTQQLLGEYDESTPPPESLQVALINEFNRLIKGPSIFDKERFAHVNLSQEVQLLIEQISEGEDLKCLNRLLIEEAYPREIAKSPKFKPGTYELLQQGSYKTLEIVVEDMKTTDSYVVVGPRDLTLVFTEVDNDKEDMHETIHFSDDGGISCFITTSAWRK